MQHSVPAHVPPHLAEATFHEPPPKVIALARSYGASDVAFLDDAVRVRNSVRYFSSIFVNTRGTHWGNLIGPPWGAGAHAEAIAFRVLHEVGHVNAGHPGDSRLVSTPTSFEVPEVQDFWRDGLDGQEGEARLFALRFREDQPRAYGELVSACSRWVASHRFAGKDWEDDAEAQWRRLHGAGISTACFSIPGWVAQRYGSVLRHHGSLCIFDPAT